MNHDVDADMRQAAYELAAEDIAAEADLARVQHPPFNSAHEGWAVLFEEVDECWDEVRADNLERAIAEAVQAGAMALRFVADMRVKLSLTGARA